MLMWAISEWEKQGEETQETSSTVDVTWCCCGHHLAHSQIWSHSAYILHCSRELCQITNTTCLSVKHAPTAECHAFVCMPQLSHQLLGQHKKVKDSWATTKGKFMPYYFHSINESSVWWIIYNASNIYSNIKKERSIRRGTHLYGMYCACCIQRQAAVKLMHQSSVLRKDGVELQPELFWCIGHVCFNFSIDACAWMCCFCVCGSYWYINGDGAHVQTIHAPAADPHFSARQFACLASGRTCLTLHAYMMTNPISNLLCLPAAHVQYFI